MREWRVGQNGRPEVAERVEAVNPILAADIDDHYRRVPGRQPDQSIGPSPPPSPNLIVVEARVVQAVSR
jgi:hypothetical protein